MVVDLKKEAEISDEMSRDELELKAAVLWGDLAYERDENQHLRKLVAEMFQEHNRIYNNNTWGLPHSYPHASSKQMASWYSECIRWGIEVYSS